MLIRGLAASLAMLTVSGCLQVGYTQGIKSDATTRAVKNATGTELDGEALAIGMPAHLLFLDKDQKAALGADLEFESSIDGDAEIASAKLRFQYDVLGSWRNRRPGEKKLEPARALVLSAGAGVYQLQHTEIPNEGTFGGYVGISYIHTSALFAEARYRYVVFDTSFGDLDASGFELLVGLDLARWFWYSGMP
jgi:hypothetical protein